MVRRIPAALVLVPLEHGEVGNPKEAVILRRIAGLLECAVLLRIFLRQIEPQESALLAEVLHRLVHHSGNFRPGQCRGQQPQIVGLHLRKFQSPSLKLLDSPGQTASDRSSTARNWDRPRAGRRRRYRWCAAPCRKCRQLWECGSTAIGNSLRMRNFAASSSSSSGSECLANVHHGGQPHVRLVISIKPDGLVVTHARERSLDRNSRSSEGCGREILQLPPTRSPAADTSFPDRSA